MPVLLSKSLAFVLALSTFAGAGAALAAGSHSGGHSSAIGEPGDPAAADRTIEITMGDNFYEPERLTISAGETVRFVIRNDGEFLHEFNLGTAAMHAEHQTEMMAMMEQGVLTPTGLDHSKMKMDHGDQGMAHDDANSVLVEPGKTMEIAWKFTADTSFEFACNIPGHYESGMVGEIDITKSALSGS